MPALPSDLLAEEAFVPPAPEGAAIASVGASLPKTVVPNAEIAARIGVSDEWIVRRTGIHARRVAEPDERLTTHAPPRAPPRSGGPASPPSRSTSCWSRRPPRTR